MGDLSPHPPRVWKAGLYTRLSREDGDKAESNSIANQREILASYIARTPGLHPQMTYIDDGCTGTNFDRPGFQAMLRDIQRGAIDCVVVKDLSRFGRDYIDAGYYLERWLPAHGVRFIAVADGIDTCTGAYDMLLPMKNVFNEQYARDISKKIRASIRAKQERGDFVGAFPSYGYRKEEGDRNKLAVDPAAAQVVRRIFDLFEGGMGKVRIAKTLNSEKIPCPSEYKRLSGENYRNGSRKDQTTYWTYATIHRILKNRMYTGAMTQARDFRPGMHAPAKKQEESQWVVVPNTHEAIIDPAQWARVQRLLEKTTRQPAFQTGVSPFAGFLICGDCGRAMCKTKRAGGIQYCCGSYKRYGAGICTKHAISHRELEEAVLGDLNRILAAVPDLTALVREAVPPQLARDLTAPREKLGEALARVARRKQDLYEDYREGLLTKADFLAYQADYAAQQTRLTAQLAQLDQEKPDDPLDQPWVRALLEEGKLTALDRATVAETIREIRVFEGRELQITYQFSDDLGLFGEGEAPTL
jgi:DNA invertase Pin-like site-specific DNA recombinase